MPEQTSNFIKFRRLKPVFTDPEGGTKEDILKFPGNLNYR
jgi:hypothetical protein